MNKKVWIIFALVFWITMILLVVSFKKNAWAESEFPLCENQTTAGDHAHYATGTHQIAGDGLLQGSDDVYALGDSHFLQCFCSPEGRGIQTNWSPNSEGEEWGLDWNLDETFYGYENREYSCSKVTPTPEPQGRIELTSAGAPTCDGVPFVLLPANALVKRLGGNAIVQWNPTQGDKVNIYFYEKQNPLNAHSLIGVANDGYEDNLHLLGTKDWVFGVQQLDGCAASGIVWVIDSAGYRLFSLPSYDIVSGRWL